MKSTYQIRGQMFSDFFGYSKKRKVSSGVKENQVKESEHVLSRVTGTVCNNMMDDQLFLTDPATLGGRIELGDRVALASSPKKLLGELIGITGFRRAVVMLEAGGTNEYGAEDLVMLEKKDVFKDNVPGVAFEPVDKNESRKSRVREDEDYGIMSPATIAAYKAWRKAADSGGDSNTATITLSLESDSTKTKKVKVNAVGLTEIE